MIWMAFPINEQLRLTDMYSLFQTHFDYGYEFPGETHNFWECLYVVKGEVCVSADERVYNLTCGEIIFHKPLELHKFIINDKDGADLLVFSFSAEGPLTTFLRDKVFELSPSQKAIISNMLSYAQSRCEQLCPVPGNSCPYLEPFREYPAYAQMLGTYLLQLMLSLSERGSVTSASSAPDAICFSSAISYLNSNIHRQPTVPEIARFCNVSEAGIKRIFDKYAGIGVHKYLLKLKIKAAAELLHNGESVSNVAERLGFNSQSYFSRAFKRETGMMPSSLK